MSRTSPRVPRTTGMISASQASRRTTAGGRSRPSPVSPVTGRAAAWSTPASSASWVMVTRSRAGVPWESGTAWVSRACWASWTRASHIRAPPSRGSRSARARAHRRCCRGRGRGRRGGGGGGAGQRQQGGLQQGAVLDRAAAFEADPAGAVVGDRQVPVGVGGACFAVELGLQCAVHAVGVDDGEQVASGAGQVGGVEPGRVADQGLLRPPAHPRHTREVGHRGHDDVGLPRRHRPRDHRLPGPPQRPGHSDGAADQACALTAA